MIPKIFYQTFESADLVPGMAAARQTWIDQNPDWEHVFHDADQRRALLAGFGDDAVRAYDMLTNGAFKADLWRYCALYRTGGGYADIDSVCLVPIETYLRDDDRFVATKSVPRPDGNLDWVIYNALIFAEPEHPFLKTAIDRAVGLILGGETDGYFATGPSGLGQAMNKSLGRAPKTRFDAGPLGDGARLFQKDGKRVMDGDMAIFHGEYEGYKDDLATVGIAHWHDEKAEPGLVGKVLRKLRRWRA